MFFKQHTFSFEVEVELNASFSRTGTQHKIMPPGEEERDSQTNLVINNGLGSFFNNLETSQGNITVLHLQQKERVFIYLFKFHAILF